MAANRKIHLDTDHPERFSQFVPEGAQGLMRFDAILLADELIVNLSMISNGERIKFSEKEQRLTGAAVISPYNPRKRSNKRFDVFPKWEIYNEFNTGDTHQITFSITSEEQELLKKYKDCYFYFTIVTETGSGRIIRYFDTRGVTSSLGDYPVSPVQFTNES